MKSAELGINANKEGGCRIEKEKCGCFLIVW